MDPLRGKDAGIVSSNSIKLCKKFHLPLTGANKWCIIFFQARRRHYEYDTRQ